MSEDRANSILARYDEIQTRITAAYGAFSSVYDQQHPQPSKPEDAEKDWTVIVALSVIVIAALIVSGSRTIVEFAKQGGIIVGIAGFFMLEITALVLSYLRVKWRIRSSNHESRKLVTAGMYIAFGVMIVANLDATLRQGGVVYSETVNLIILIAVALSAPTLTLISGDALGIEVARQQHLQREIDRVFTDTLQAWRNDKEANWNTQKARWGATVRVETEAASMPVQLVQLDSGHESGQGYKRESAATKKVREYLALNPEAASMPVRELADVIGVGKSTVGNVLVELRSQNSE